MGTTASIFIFTFWTAFFTALSLKGLFVKEHSLASDRMTRLFQLNRTRKEMGERNLAIDKGQENTLIKKLRDKLLLAGLKRRSDLEKFLLVRRICYVTPLTLSLIAYISLHISFQNVFLLGLLSGIFSILAPRFWLAKLISKHRREIKRYLPDTLDLFVVALDAGLSFDSALVRIGQEQQRVSTHVSRELLYTNHEILIGKPREDALKDLAKRSGVQEMESIVKAILQSNKLGTSLVKTLRAQADGLRKKRKQEIHAQILKAPVKLIFPLLFFIFPTLLVVILGPSLVQIFRYLKFTGAPS
ncbi:MAG: type II secretion system F family protein [Candidatus Omnitrophica bacterium]|nr:type II secretion system F family protein [Candidatus Omnitrophota bacterium]